MSRYELDPLSEAVADHGALSIAIGWDAPLNTYFAMVLRDGDDVDDEHRDLLWIGTRYGEIADPDAAIEALRPYAVIRNGLAAELTADRLQEGSRPRSPLIR
ncbi:hypothetical protein DFR49_0726 [Hephaestia caeni]|uniref:Uncharacterized protein n=1 Tax=Hephaestia caeni TaxID=645617 RepID=A0A397PCP6_9SPHN|nr:hypothetical protein [Hephaestia caeni]RIA46193.1 hypothetical protein DFR49_0726 [Hephaestia caeni]